MARFEPEFWRLERQPTKALPPTDASGEESEHLLAPAHQVFLLIARLLPMVRLLRAVGVAGATDVVRHTNGVAVAVRGNGDVVVPNLFLHIAHALSLCAIAVVARFVVLGVVNDLASVCAGWVSGRHGWATDPSTSSWEYAFRVVLCAGHRWFR
jgi:hypothetical protein